MQDTTEEIIQKQREIIFAKTEQERFLLGVEMINFGRIVVESSIKQNNPGICELDLKIAVLKRYYSTQYKPDELKNIIQSLKNYYNQFGEK